MVAAEGRRILKVLRISDHEWCLFVPSRANGRECPKI